MIETDGYYETLEQTMTITGPRLLNKNETNYSEEDAYFVPQVQWKRTPVNMDFISSVAEITT